MNLTNKQTLLLTASCALMLAACTPTVAQRGNMLEDYQITQIAPGVHTRSDVLQLLGSPTTQAPFDDNIWYYIGQETEKRGIFDPEVVKERVIVVAFNDDGTVQQLRELPKGSRVDIPIARGKTPTHGNDVTIMQQLLGNLGRFNAPQGSGRAGPD